MNIILRNIQYHPGPVSGPVALLLEHSFGSFFVNTTEAALDARLPDGATTWGNAEALAEAQAKVDVLYPMESHVVALPEAPTAPPAE